jgi:hypothetical protein
VRSRRIIAAVHAGAASPEETAAVTAIQRAGSFANANLHFHTLVPEGVWHEDADGAFRYHPLPPPTDAEVEAIATRIVHKVTQLLARLDADEAAADREVDALALAHAEAVQQPLAVAATKSPPRTSSARRRCAFIDGFSLHANTVVDAADRPALERLCRYLLRPLICADRLTQRPDGRVEYHFRRPDPTGRTSWVTDGPSWCRRLATLIPPRRSHTVRFHGVLSSAHRWRPHVVPPPPTVPQPSPPSSPTTMMRLAQRLDWAQLLRRVFGEDVTRCPQCGDHLRVLALLSSPPRSSNTSAFAPRCRPSPPRAHRPPTTFSTWTWADTARPCSVTVRGATPPRIYP